MVFQSTLPARGATIASGTSAILVLFQSTLPARGATISGTPYKQTSDISIHAPRTGSDVFAAPKNDRRSKFQSTLPARGATASLTHNTDKKRISIHAPRTGSDSIRNHDMYIVQHFNPRSPHGERLYLPYPASFALAFQSTLPARGATAFSPPFSFRAANFNPRSPHGERREHYFITQSDGTFQSTLPARGATATIP